MQIVVEIYAVYLWIILVDILNFRFIHLFWVDANTGLHALMLENCNLFLTLSSAATLYSPSALF